MKVCGITFSEIETDSLKAVFKNADDSVRYSFVQSVLKSRTPEINNNSSTHRSGLQAERCFEESKQLAQQNKHRCAVKKLNEALAHSKEPKFTELVLKQRELLIKFLGSDEPKENLRSHKIDASLVDLIYSGALQNFEAFSQAVKVEFSEEFGRHVVALEDLEPGHFFNYNKLSKI